MDFPKKFIKKNIKMRWKINSPCTGNKHKLLHLWASCLESGRVTIPQININLYFVSRIIMFKIQKDPSNRTYLSHGNPSVYRRMTTTTTVPYHNRAE